VELAGRLLPDQLAVQVKQKIENCFSSRNATQTNLPFVTGVALA